MYKGLVFKSGSFRAIMLEVRKCVPAPGLSQLAPHATSKWSGFICLYISMTGGTLSRGTVQTIDK